MNELRFEWDDDKAIANLRKHRVSFSEAESAFDDPHRKRAFDASHSAVEDRWLLIGISKRLRLLAVAYTKRNEKIRIINARRANQAEESRYTGEA